ncbi:MAG: efflux RND transporter periplasmic adaptor subunit [Anaerolineae bacterium]|nr:efflux RND transporter periplasmic adaptor subunit [Anaerolineae bacterium]
MFRKKTFWIVLGVILLVAGGGYAAYARGLVPWWGSQKSNEPETTFQTSSVTVGNLSITADGSGTLVPSSTVNLSFGASGELLELLVEVGDLAQVGDMLARIDDTDARNAVAEAELRVLEAEEALENARDTAALEQAVAQAELKVMQAEASLATARSNLEDLLNWTVDETEVEIAQANLNIAEASYQNTVAKAGMWDGQLASTRINLEEAIRSLKEAQANYAHAMDAARDWERNIESTRQNAIRALEKAQNNHEIAQVSYDLALIDTRQIDIQNAWIKVLNARQSLEDLQTPPEESEITAARIAVRELEVALRQAQLDLAEAQNAFTTPDGASSVNTAKAELALEQARLQLESAKAALQGTTLVAPISGTVVGVNAEVGEKVSGTVVVLADLASPVVQFWVEESDLTSLAVGNPVRLVFEALPDLTFEGEITRIDPAMVTVGNTAAVQAWASIDTAAHPVKLLSDMNVEVEVVSGEALNALLVPVTALRKLDEDQYAVFVVKADGELEMRVVEVGLQDYVNAEIRSGLQRGEVVRTGERTSSSSTQRSTNTDPFRPPDSGGPGMFFFGG